MRKVLPFAAVCLVLILVVSCWRNLARHEAVIKGAIELLNELADALEGVKDRASARVAAVKIDKVCDRLGELSREAESLPRIRKVEDERLQKKYEREIRKASDRMETAAFRAAPNSGGDPAFLKAVARLEEVGNSLDKIGKK